MADQFHYGVLDEELNCSSSSIEENRAESAMYNETEDLGNELAPSEIRPYHVEPVNDLKRAACLKAKQDVKLFVKNESTPIIVREPKTIGDMLETKHHWLPVILAIFLPAAFLITYAIAVAKNHVEAGFPYISDTGTFPPESCVFGQLLNIGAVISGIIIYIRYRHIYTLFKNVPERKGLLKLNLATFWVGMVTNLGVSMVGNFQESNVLPVHLLGAFLAFFVGWIYCVLQTVISFKTAGTSEMMGNTQTMRRVRVVVTVLDAIFIAIAGLVSLLANKKGPGPSSTRYTWDSSDPGYAEHVIATVSEWLAAFAIVIYFSTFYNEFKHFRLTAPQIIHYNTSIKNEEQLGQRVSTISNNIT